MRGYTGIIDLPKNTTPTSGIVQSNLIRHYDLQDSSCYGGSGTVLTDLSPQGVNGNLGGSPLWSVQGGADSLRFAGGQWVDTTGSHTCTSWSIGIWVRYYTNQSGSDPRIWSSHNQNDWYVRNQSYSFYSSVGGTYTHGTNFLPSTEWHYIVTTFGGGVLKWYKNNVLVNSSTRGKTMTVLNFMRYRGGNYYGRGYLGEMQWYDKELTAAEVTTNWDATRASYGK